jgi:hypothetical protein
VDGFYIFKYRNAVSKIANYDQASAAGGIDGFFETAFNMVDHLALYIVRVNLSQQPAKEVYDNLIHILKF